MFFGTSRREAEAEAERRGSFKRSPRGRLIRNTYGEGFANLDGWIPG